jgi:hypothetical protein
MTGHKSVFDIIPKALLLWNTSGIHNIATARTNISDVACILESCDWYRYPYVWHARKIQTKENIHRSGGLTSHLGVDATCSSGYKSGTGIDDIIGLHATAVEASASSQQRSKSSKISALISSQSSFSIGPVSGKNEKNEWISTRLDVLLVLVVLVFCMP